MYGKYILEDQNTVICDDIIKWGKWLETADRKVAKDTIGDSDISTVFLGLDHSFGSGAPMLFETMVFGGKYDQEQERYSTWNEAVLGHNKMVQKVKKGAKK